MAKSHSLFLLIKSLTKAEKRYLKLYLSKYQSGGNKAYMQLFDIIDAQKEYNEKAVLKKTGREKYHGQLSSLKKYLHGLILKTLRTFHEQASIDTKLNNYLSEIEFLFKKGLFNDCAASIKRAKSIAGKYEKIPRLLELIAWEDTLAFQTNNTEYLESVLQKEMAEKDLLLKYEEIAALKQLSMEVRCFILKKGTGRADDETKKFFRHILSNKILAHEMSTYSGEMNRLAIKGICSLSSGSYQERFDGLNNIIKYMEQYPFQIDEFIGAYFGNLLELAIITLRAKKFLAAGKLIEKIKRVYEANENKLDVRSKMGFLHILTSFYLEQGEFILAKGLLPQINSLIEINHKKLDAMEALFLYSLRADVYFRNGDYKNAQSFIYKIINYDSGIRLDIQSSARIINLILQYEQREFEHLGYLIRSTYRYLMKKQRLLPPELIIIDFLRKATKLNSPKEAIDELADLKQQLLPHMYEPFIMRFPLIEWIDSKIQKRSLTDAIKERYANLVAEERAEQPEVIN